MSDLLTLGRRAARRSDTVVGANTDTVRAVQIALKAAGFDPRGVDGKMGPDTEAAITAFWASRGLSHAPVIDDDLISALGIALASNTPAATPVWKKVVFAMLVGGTALGGVLLLRRWIR